MPAVAMLEVNWGVNKPLNAVSVFKLHEVDLPQLKTSNFFWTSSTPRSISNMKFTVIVALAQALAIPAGKVGRTAVLPRTSVQFLASLRSFGNSFSHRELPYTGYGGMGNEDAEIRQCPRILKAAIVVFFFFVEWWDLKLCCWYIKGGLEDASFLFSLSSFFLSLFSHLIGAVSSSSSSSLLLGLGSLFGLRSHLSCQGTSSISF